MSTGSNLPPFPEWPDTAVTGLVEVTGDRHDDEKPEPAHQTADYVKTPHSESRVRSAPVPLE
jgi:hypothetical protein